MAKHRTTTDHDTNPTVDTRHKTTTVHHRAYPATPAIAIDYQKTIQAYLNESLKDCHSAISEHRKAMDAYHQALFATPSHQVLASLLKAEEYRQKHFGKAQPVQLPHSAWSVKISNHGAL